MLKSKLCVDEHLSVKYQVTEIYYCHFCKFGKVVNYYHHKGHFIKREVWDHKTSLTPQLFIEVPVPSQESEWP